MRLALVMGCFFGIGNAELQAADSRSSLAELNAQRQRLSKTVISAPLNSLSPGDRKALEKIIAASRELTPLYLEQVWSGNPALKSSLSQDHSKKGQVLFALFNQYAGPWIRIEEDRPFLEGVPKTKPETAGFYPEGLTRAEFESWVAKLPASERQKAVGFFSVISRDVSGKLQATPFSKAYKKYLEPASKLLKEAAALTSNASLSRYLNLRAEAFLSDDYYASDVAWMDLDAPLEVTIGPYETYEDRLFGYKAAFESFVTIRNDAETAKLQKFSGLLQELENHLPIDPKYRNPKLGASAPIRVVDSLFSSGDARRGVMTAAFNLPNDEKVIKEKGSKRVMLKNVQQAKFDKVLKPIAQVVLDPSDQKQIAFEPFFTHILMHELMHGLGPHAIEVNGKESTPRAELKELYSALEEAKADITGLWAMQYLMDKKEIDPRMQDSMYTTYLASAFRSVRFGIEEAHGKGIALQFNYLTDHGAISVHSKTGRFRIVPEKVRAAVTGLAGEILTLQAEGSYSKGKALLEKYGVIRPAMAQALKKMGAIPVDIDPRYIAAGE